MRSPRPAQPPRSLYTLRRAMGPEPPKHTCSARGRAGRTRAGCSGKAEKLIWARKPSELSGSAVQRGFSAGLLHRYPGNTHPYEVARVRTVLVGCVPGHILVQPAPEVRVERRQAVAHELTFWGPVPATRGLAVDRPASRPSSAVEHGPYPPKHGVTSQVRAGR